MKKRISILVSLILAASLLFSAGGITAFSTSGKISRDIIAVTGGIAERIESEGAVLLKNEDGFLPIKGTKINVFGVCSAFPYIGGTGSGCTTSDDPVWFYDALDEKGIEYNSELRGLYEKNGGRSDLPYVDHTIVNNLINIALLRNAPDEMNPSKLTQKIIDNAVSFSDTAVIIIGRTGTEGGDLKKEMLRPDDKEKAMIDKVCSAFDNVIVIFNTGNVVEMGWTDEYDSIKAVLEVWIPGEFGFRSVADILTGAVNPSGRLCDTIAYSIDDYPSTECFGSYEFSDGSGNYVEYKDGIYVGYRYFETMAKDKVQYPFGYGLSYTTFTQSITGHTEDGENITLNVNVTNTGEAAGKDTVQVYYSAPYTPGGIEKSAICLAAFDKTPLLAPGESCAIEITFPVRDMASYDYLGREAYVLEKGDYEIILGKNVREHYESFTVTFDEDIVYKTDAVTGTEIKNLFGFADSKCAYLSRNDPQGTFPVESELKKPETVKTADEYPEPVKEGEKPVTGAKYDKTITLADVAQDDTLWEKFLDQFTLDELIKMAVHGGYQTYGIERLGVPQTMDDDGPLSVKGRNGTVFSDSGTAYPCEVCVACTWNTDLAREMGEGAGTEAADMGVDVWYAPAVNIHRSPLGGRNYEYYSEDPLISGKIAAAVVNGCKSKGLVTTIKHFALNDQETHRNGGNIFCNEQAMREIYLRAFEIPVKEAGTMGMMSAYNRIGGYWCGGCSPLLNGLLRDEWGFGGFVVSDYSSNLFFGTYMSPVLAVYNGNDVLLNG
ncbi:MAG: glycoside hydrolase family 3 C-terminal domain-containing protein, partial [Clostridia bacterium]|nr:glycoside hydrolase family 3 C-terminal domain-containing protein [Clostridia bacterium]